MMEFIKDEKFDIYVENFKHLPLEEKKEQTIKQIQEILTTLEQLSEKNGLHPKTLFNKEILDLKKENPTEADFIEATFVYCYSIKELIASLMESLNK